MTLRTTALAVATASIAFVSVASSLSAQAQTPPDSQWRMSQTTLSTLLQDGYKIFVQRDQTAFKCIDPQQADAKTKASVAPPACFELVPPSGAAAASEAR